MLFRSPRQRSPKIIRCEGTPDAAADRTLEDHSQERTTAFHLPNCRQNRGVAVMSFHAIPSKQTAPNALPTYAATDLTEGRDQAQIVLGDQVYTLRITRAGKLILTK